MKKVLVIVGPTAIGKTSLSIELAKLFNGEIISGDSIQVYKGFDIGSGKVSSVEMDNVKHYGIDILEPNQEYNAYIFQETNRKIIDQITNDHKLPIICGGTGLYIKALLYDYTFSKHDKLDYSVYDKFTNEEIYQELEKLDPKALKVIHINNRQRLVRALALAHNNTLISETKENQKHELLYDALIIGLTSDRETVYNRINKRVEMMFEDGLEKEVLDLLKNNISFKNQAMQAIGYREFETYFNNEITIDEVKTLIQRNSRRFAKRQYTWFNNQTNVLWFDLNKKEEIINKVKIWMEN